MNGPLRPTLLRLPYEMLPDGELLAGEDHAEPLDGGIPCHHPAGQLVVEAEPIGAQPGGRHHADPVTGSAW